MELARVRGTVVASVKSEGLGGVKLLIIEPLDHKGRPRGGYEVAVDSVQAGPGDLVAWVQGREGAMSEALPQWFVPVDAGTVVMSDDPAAAGGLYGAADIVTKKKFRDFRLHVEFLVTQPGGNSGLYLQNRYEIQILDGDRTSHGMGAIINHAPIR